MVFGFDGGEGLNRGATRSTWPKTNQSERRFKYRPNLSPDVKEYTFSLDVFLTPGCKICFKVGLLEVRKLLQVWVTTNAYFIVFFRVMLCESIMPLTWLFGGPFLFCFLWSPQSRLKRTPFHSEKTLWNVEIWLICNCVRLVEKTILYVFYRED